MGPLLDGLNGLGASARALGPQGLPPVEVRGILRGGTVSIPGSVSSQFLSSLLLACPLAKSPSTVHVLPPVRSEPYVDVTLAMLRHFGGEASADGHDLLIPGGQSYRAADFQVPGDFSSAAFPLVAAAITQGDVTVEGLEASMPQGDRRVVDVLADFGAAVATARGTVRVHARKAPLRGRTVDLNDTPDLFPVLAVLATQAEGESRFVHGEHLRLKESDRIASTVAFLSAMGARAAATPDGCVVRGPNRLHGASVDSLGDHRILMAAAVAGLVADDAVEITEPECYRVSYPTFLEDLRSLGAPFEVVA